MWYVLIGLAGVETPKATATGIGCNLLTSTANAMPIGIGKTHCFTAICIRELAMSAECTFTITIYIFRVFV